MAAKKSRTDRRSVLEPKPTQVQGRISDPSYFFLPVPMTIARGEPVGDFTFLKSDGNALELRSFFGKPLLLILLRHLA